MSQAAVKFLDRGPEYIRARMMHRDSGLARQHRRSAVELLEESKSFYIKDCKAADATMQNYPLRQRVGSGSSGQDSRLSSSGVLTATASSSQPSSSLPEPAAVSGAADQSSEEGPSRPPCVCSQSQQHPQSVRAWATKSKLSPRNGMYDVDNRHHSTATRQHGHSNNNNNTDSRSTSMCEEDVEGVQSDFSGLSLKRPKYTDEEMDCSSKAVVKTESETVSKPAAAAVGIPSISAEEWRERETRTESTCSEMEQTPGAGSPLVVPVLDHNLVSVKRRHKKPLSRSRTDLTKRFSSSSDLSELSARLSRNSADLEKFFNEMGLEKSVLEPLVTSALAQRPSGLSLLDNVSSIDSIDARSWCSEDSQKPDGHKAMDVGDKAPSIVGGSSSVVERNARIIKWLCNVRKSTTPPESEN